MWDHSALRLSASAAERGLLPLLHPLLDLGDDGLEFGVAARVSSYSPFTTCRGWSVLTPNTAGDVPQPAEIVK